MNKNKGFTLIELMIVVSIIGILASIAYPNYVEQVKKSKRTDAKTALYKVAQQQEEYFIQNMSYAANIDKLNDPTGASSAGLSATTTIESQEKEYKIAITAVLPANCDSISTGTACVSYTVTASSQNSQALDTKCKKFILNNLSQETAEDSSGVDTSTVCW